MVWFKACPRCQGDLATGADQYEPYVTCVQCGHYVNPAAQAMQPVSRPRLPTHTGVLPTVRNIRYVSLKSS